jgi:hypothetical protein
VRPRAKSQEFRSSGVQEFRSSGVQEFFLKERVRKSISALKNFPYRSSHGGDGETGSSQCSDVGEEIDD